jgi:hypothetical protein
MPLPPISREQRAVLQHIYDHLRRTGEWLNFGPLDRQYAGAGVDLAELLPTIPRAYVRLDRSRLLDPPPELSLELWLFGLAQCEASEADVTLFFDLLRWLAQVESTADDAVASEAGFLESQLHSPRGGWTDSPSAARRVSKLLNSEPVRIWRTFSTTEEGWRATLTREIRKYRDVATVEEYLALVEVSAPQLYGLGEPRPPALNLREVVYGVSSSAVEPKTAYIFVIMPFAEPWTDEVYALIRRAAQVVGQEHELTIERADEIAESGKITDQIEAAIRRADVVIADISGVHPEEAKDKRNHANPNVMWELGYAHALLKPAVILNQAPGNSPFDLSVHRQVAYHLPTTGGDEAALGRHLRAALGLPASSEAPVA